MVPHISAQLYKIIFGRNGSSLHFICFYLNHFFFQKYNQQQPISSRGELCSEVNQIYDGEGHSILTTAQFLRLIVEVRECREGLNNLNRHARSLFDLVIAGKTLVSWNSLRLGNDHVNQRKFLCDLIEGNDIQGMKLLKVQNDDDSLDLWEQFMVFSGKKQFAFAACTLELIYLLQVEVDYVQYFERNIPTLIAQQQTISGQDSKYLLDS